MGRCAEGLPPRELEGEAVLPLALLALAALLSLEGQTWLPGGGFGGG